MTNEVYANGMEIVCKAAMGKSICAFPDVCLSPPSPPAGPVPIPYPNTAFASDTANGSTSVKISGKEIMLKDKSHFKKSTGDEAATRSFGANVITHALTGKASFVMWSMDVKVEGANVDRNLDLTVHNHQCTPPGTPPWPHTSKMAVAFGEGGKCEKMEHLRLQQYKTPCPQDAKGNDQTGHHLVPGRCMRDTFSTYNHDNAPVICVSKGNQHQGSHKACHARFDPVERDHFEKAKPFPYSDARKAAAASAGGAMDPERDLTPAEEECVAFQLDEYYKAQPPQGIGVKDTDPVRTSGAAGKVNVSPMP